MQISFHEKLKKKFLKKVKMQTLGKKELLFFVNELPKLRQFDISWTTEKFASLKRKVHKRQFSY